MDSKTIELILTVLRLLWSLAEKGKLEFSSVREVAHALLEEQIIDESQFHSLVDGAAEILKKD